MSKKIARGTKRGRATTRPRKSEKSGKRTADGAQRFVTDLLIRGEAAERDSAGKVPQQATHAVKKVNRDGSVEVERVRFKTF
jgi:polyhydroxyalkanoate synthesis regulator phasin